MPVATEPDATVPDATVPDATEPVATVPDATVPDATVPDATAPVATAPVATEPDYPTFCATSPFHILIASICVEEPLRAFFEFCFFHFLPRLALARLRRSCSAIRILA